MAQYYGTEGLGSGNVHARIVDDAERIIRQFNTPALSAGLLDKIITGNLSPTTAPVEWSTYHKMTDIHRLQLETIFESLYSLDSNACAGWKVPASRGFNAHSEILRAVLISLNSLIFVRTSTTITMGTLKGDRTLVANEGVASLKADCELVSCSLVVTLSILTCHQY